MRLSGAMDADQGVAVAAFVSEGQVEWQRRPAVALADDERGRRQHTWQRLRQLAPEALRQAVWRGGKGENGFTSPPPWGGGGTHRGAAAHLRPPPPRPRGWPLGPPPRPPRGPRPPPPRAPGEP